MKLLDKEIFLNRNAGVDLLRAAAIMLVVLFHFDKFLRIGFIGVDLFFVLSGYLVSKFYLKEISSNQKVEWKTFFIKRFLKILPSYYFFIFFGSAIAYFFLLPEHASQVIPLADFPKYVFFYLNYDLTFHWSFELAWSLCVEEHFYVFLSLIFICIAFVKNPKRKKTVLKGLVISFILLALVFKIIGYQYGYDTYASSHMRMDALFLGVLLSFNEETENKRIKTKWPLVIGILLLIGLIIWFYQYPSAIFTKIIQHTLFPFSFFLILMGVIHLNIPKLQLLQLIAYYSFNWYLWHALTAYFVMNFLQLNFYIELALYLVVSFVIAILSTKLIEEPFLKLRKPIIAKLSNESH